MPNVPPEIRYAAPRSGAAGSSRFEGRSVEATNLAAATPTTPAGAGGWGDPV